MMLVPVIKAVHEKRLQLCNPLSINIFLIDKYCPIKNFESDTPYYERYVVDLRKLTLEGYIGQLPAAAFEQGGSYYFVIVDPEEQRVVKMLDLVVVQKVGDVQREVDDYRRNHQGNIPAGEAISPNWYLIDYDKLKLDPVEFISPYSQQKISLMIHKDGQVAVDYAAEIMKMMQQHSIEQPEVSDLREYLVEYTYFVPAASVPYLWQDDMPVAQP